jgi:hypothetical protein
MSLITASNSGRSLAEPPSQAPDGRSAPGDADLATEVAALAALLAEVVRLSEDSALFPSRWALIAELALEHDSVRAALLAADKDNDSALPDDNPAPLSTEHIIAQLNSLRDLISDDHARC